MRYNRINLMLPTRGRSDKKLPRFIASCIALVSNPKNICITFLLDVDDNKTISFVNDLKLPVSFEILYWKENQPHHGKMYNQLYEETTFKDEGTIVSLVADDMEFKTSGYDIAILNAINKCNGMGIIYCNDDYVQGKKLCVNIFTTRKYVESTKYPFMCELFRANFIDTVWMKVAVQTKTAYYLPNVILKHHHSSADPKNKDVTTVRLGKVKKSFIQGYKEVNQYSEKIIKNLKGVL